jgi:hypothetical protein
VKPSASSRRFTSRSANRRSNGKHRRSVGVCGAVGVLALGLW